MVLVLQIGPGSNKIRAKIISDLNSSKYTPVTQIAIFSKPKLIIHLFFINNIINIKVFQKSSFRKS